MPVILIKRRRVVYVVIAALVVALGLYTRSGSTHIPKFIATYAGDTLWACLLYLVLAIQFRRICARLRGRDARPRITPERS